MIYLFLFIFLLCMFFLFALNLYISFFRQFEVSLA